MKYITLLGFLTSLLPNKVEMLECYQCIDTKDDECVVNTTTAPITIISNITAENPDASLINLKNVSELSQCKDLQNKVAKCDNSHPCQIVIIPDLCSGVGKT